MGEVLIWRWDCWHTMQELCCQFGLISYNANEVIYTRIVNVQLLVIYFRELGDARKGFLMISQRIHSKMADFHDQPLLPHEAPFPEFRSESRQPSITSSSPFSGSTIVTLSGPIPLPLLVMLRRILPITDIILISPTVSNSPVEECVTEITDLQQVDGALKALQATEKSFPAEGVSISDSRRTIELETESISIQHIQYLSSWARQCLNDWHGRLLVVINRSNVILDSRISCDQDDIGLFLFPPKLEHSQGAASPEWLGTEVATFHSSRMTNLEVLEEIVDRILQRLSGRGTKYQLCPCARSLWTNLKSRVWG